MGQIELFNHFQYAKLFLKPLNYAQIELLVLDSNT